MPRESHSLLGSYFGLVSYDGRILPQPDEESQQFAQLFHTHRRACQFRDRAALLQMGRWCSEGTVSPVDLVEAYKWFGLAATAGDATAQTELAKLRARLSREQFDDAEQRIAKLRRW